MKVISTNLGKPTTFIWEGKEEQTGIFKKPVSQSIQLNKHDVANDTIINRVNHGGVHKACYLFSSDNYPYWKKLYPKLDWNWGMFGENLTIDSFDEATIRVGDIYKLGTALVQVSQPREPCYKLGIRFGNQDILKQFVDHKRPGTYVRILEEGEVKTGDTLELQQQSENTLTTKQFYELMFMRKKPKELLDLFMSNPSVPQYKKDRFLKYI
jgi:MOSC domain-containing protein YiiM